MNNLCCCEYLDEDGERNHLLACCCNCQDLDQGFEGLISGKDVSSATKLGIIKTIQDRLRVPWIGGAVQIPPDVALPLITLPSLLLLATINFQFAIISSITLILFLIVIYKYFIESVPNFFVAWTVISLLVLYIIFEVLVVSFLQILLEENIGLSITILGFIFCMYMTKSKIIHSKQSLLSPEKYNKSSYCSKCQIYTMEENQHYFWIDCCIIKSNQQFYIGGLICAFVALVYSSNLTLTSVCHPYTFYKTILLPDDCSDVYEMIELSLSFVTALYSCLLAIFILWQFILQISGCIYGARKICQCNIRCSLFHWIRVMSGSINHRIIQNT